jgi:putative transposase
MPIFGVYACSLEIPLLRGKCLRENALQKRFSAILSLLVTQSALDSGLETDIDHVHCFVSAPPRWAPSIIAGHLKGYTSKYLREKFPHLLKKCGREQLWTQAYYVGTAGAVSTEVIRRYITDCQGR